MTPRPPCHTRPEPPPRPVILLVDDDQRLLGHLEGVLRADGYEVLAASDPLVAIRLAESHPQSIQLLLTDIYMPEMNGVELARRVVSLRPASKVLFMSGKAAPPTNDAASHPFLSKPFSPTEIVHAVQAALGDSPPEATP